ncbi:MAG: hypothetical protein ACLTZY_10600 [Alistipes indistinctus]
MSSTVIRELVSTGRLEEAARYLGSPTGSAAPFPRKALSRGSNR